MTKIRNLAANVHKDFKMSQATFKSRCRQIKIDIKWELFHLELKASQGIRVRTHHHVIHNSKKAFKFYEERRHENKLKKKKGFLVFHINMQMTLPKTTRKNNFFKKASKNIIFILPCVYCFSCTQQIRSKIRIWTMM